MPTAVIGGPLNAPASYPRKRVPDVTASRVVRMHINSSHSLSQVSLQADLTFRAMIVAADDYGRLDGRIEILKGLLFPLRKSVTVAKLNEWIHELTRGPHPPVLWYVVDERPYLRLTGWEKHRGQLKRRKRPEFPPPPESPHSTCREMPGDAGNLSPNDAGVGGGVGEGIGDGVGVVGSSPTGSVEKPTPTKKASPEGIALAELLASELIESLPHVSIPATSDRWAFEADRMLRGTSSRPAIPRADIERVIRWVVRDDFERANVQSFGKLSKRFSQLHAKATSTGPVSAAERRVDATKAAARSVLRAAPRAEG